MEYGHLLAALVFTWFAIKPVFFRERWAKDQMDFLEKEFGEKGPLDEDEVEEHRIEIVPMWLILAGVFWWLFARSI